MAGGLVKKAIVSPQQISEELNGYCNQLVMRGYDYYQESNF